MVQVQLLSFVLINLSHCCGMLFLQLGNIFRNDVKPALVLLDFMLLELESTPELCKSDHWHRDEPIWIWIV